MPQVAKMDDIQTFNVEVKNCIGSPLATLLVVVENIDAGDFNAFYFLIPTAPDIDRIAAQPVEIMVVMLVRYGYDIRTFDDLFETETVPALFRIIRIRDDPRAVWSNNEKCRVTEISDDHDPPSPA